MNEMTQRQNERGKQNEVDKGQDSSTGHRRRHGGGQHGMGRARQVQAREVRLGEEASRRVGGNSMWGRRLVDSHVVRDLRFQTAHKVASASTDRHPICFMRTAAIR